MTNLTKNLLEQTAPIKILLLKAIWKNSSKKLHFFRLLSAGRREESDLRGLLDLLDPELELELDDDELGDRRERFLRDLRDLSDDDDDGDSDRSRFRISSR